MYFVTENAPWGVVDVFLAVYGNISHAEVCTGHALSSDIWFQSTAELNWRMYSKGFWQNSETMEQYRYFSGSASQGKTMKWCRFFQWLCLSREDYEMMQILLVALPLKGRLWNDEDSFSGSASQGETMNQSRVYLVAHFQKHLLFEL
jgi:hypothetical protein